MISGPDNEIRPYSSQTSNSIAPNSLQNPSRPSVNMTNYRPGSGAAKNTNPNHEVPERRPERVPMLLEFYHNLRNFVLLGVNQIRDDLLGLLYFLFLYIYQESYKSTEAKTFKTLVQFSSSFRSDFAANQGFSKDIRLLETVLSTNEDLSRILPDLPNQKIIHVSQYSYETLKSFVRRYNCQEVYNDLIRDLNIEIKIVKDSVKETYRSTNTVITALKSDEIERINRIPINLGPLRDDLVFFNKLEAFSKLKNEHQTNSKKLNDKLNAVADTKDRNCLEKSNVILPDVKLTSQINFLKHYIEREKISVDSTLKQPSVLGVTVTDPQETITCLEFDKSFNILLLGFENSQILCHFINPHMEGLEVLDKSKKRNVETFRKVLSNESLFSETNEQASFLMKAPHSRANGVGQNSSLHDIPNCIEFIGHENAITSLSMNYDELYFLSGSVDTTIRLWCIRQRTCLQVFSGHFNTVWAVKFSPKGFYFASGSSDTTARLWSTDKSFYLRVFVGHTADVNGLEFVENCNYLVTSSYDKVMRVWELLSGLCVRVLNHNNTAVTAMASTLSGNYFASGSEDGMVIVWDITTGEKKVRLTVSKGQRINGLSFTIDEVLLSCSTKRRLVYHELGKLQNNDLYKGLMTDKTAKELGIKDDAEPVNSFDAEDQDFLTAKFHPRNFLVAVSRNIGS